MGKLVAADHDGDQARNFRHGSGEQRLQSSETVVERRALSMGRQGQEQQN